jgi:hypothetical protein
VKTIAKVATAIICIALCLIVASMLTGCYVGSEADKVNYNIGKQAEYFECERRITVYNARTDKVVFVAEGYMNISNNSTDELVVTFKVGANEYKKNYVYLNEYTLYVVEDITGTHTDPYHYKFYFDTNIFPDIEVIPLKEQN